MGRERVSEPKPIPVCPYTECTYHGSCAILDITGKAPKKDRKCSYFESSKSEKKKSSKTDSSNDL